MKANFAKFRDTIITNLENGHSITQHDKRLRDDAIRLINPLKLSASSINVYDKCEASFIYNKIIYPRISTETTNRLANVGRIFHTVAEAELDTAIQSEETAYEAEETAGLIDEFKDTLVTREYYNLPSTAEVRLEYEVRPNNVFVGIIDRVVELANNKILIVDYKTSGMVNIAKDLKQLMGYAYLLWKTEGILPKNMELLIEYIRLDEPYRFSVTESDLINHENFLISRFKRVRATVKRYIPNLNYKSLSHTPGDCTFCVVTGTCIAYNNLINAAVSDDDVEILPTIDLIQEYITLAEHKDVNDLRMAELKKTLLYRYEIESTDPTDNDSRSYSDIISIYLSRIHPEVSEYKSADLVPLIVANRTKKVIKNIPFSETVDHQLLNSVLTDIVLEILPANIAKTKIPKELLKKVDHLKKKANRKPYLKMR